MYNGCTNWESWVVHNYFSNDGEDVVLGINDEAQGDREKFIQLCQDWLGETVGLDNSESHIIVQEIASNFWSDVDWEDVADSHFIESDKTGHPAHFSTFTEVLAYIGFSDDEIDTHVDKYDSLLSAYHNSEFRSLCLKNHYSLVADNKSLSTALVNGYIDIIELGNGLYRIEHISISDIVF